MERVWIVSAFVDLRGFGTWIYRASIPREIKEPFIENYLEEVQNFLKNSKDIHFKYLGDGFLVIKEFNANEKKNGAVFDFICELRDVTKKIKILTENCSHPLTGVRIRISEGYAYKIKVLDPSDKDRKRLISEFIEYSINTAERLMEVNPEIICIVTEGVARSLGTKRESFKPLKLKNPSSYPNGVNVEDIHGLTILKF